MQHAINQHFGFASVCVFNILWSGLLPCTHNKLHKMLNVLLPFLPVLEKQRLRCCRLTQTNFFQLLYKEIDN